MNALRNLCAAAVLVCPALVAQDQDPAKPAKLNATKLKKALSTMTTLPSLAFETSTTTIAHSPFAGRVGGRAPKPRKVASSGVVSGDILAVNLNDDADHVVIRGRRMIARNDDSGWALRRSKLANGNAAPFLFDPQLFFSVLSQLPLKVIHKEVGTANNKPVETYTFSVSGETAQDLAWSGAIPEPGTSGSSAGVVRMVMVGGGGAFAAPAAKGKITVDVAVSLDPATSLVHKVRVHAYSTANNPFGPGVIVRRGFGGEDEEEEEEDKEEKEFDPQDPKFEGGLPVRKKKGKTFMRFELALTQHNSAVLPDLDGRARALLLLPR